MTSIPVLQDGHKSQWVSLYRYDGENGSGILIHFPMTTKFLFLPDGEDGKFEVREDWFGFWKLGELSGDITFPHFENLKCDFCDEKSIGVFCVQGAPVSMAMCEKHVGATWDHEKLDIYWPGR